MRLVPGSRRAARAVVASFAAYGAARLAADWSRRARRGAPASASSRRLVDDVAAPKEPASAATASSAEQAYYDWRAMSASHADELQPPVDE